MKKRNVISRYKLRENFSELYSVVGWKLELLGDECGYLAQEICKQSVEGTTWLLLVAYSKIQVEKKTKGKTIKQELEPKGWKKFLTYPYCKRMIKRALERTPSMWLDQLCQRDQTCDSWVQFTISVKTLRAQTEEGKMGADEGRLLDFWDPLS